MTTGDRMIAMAGERAAATAVDVVARETTIEMNTTGIEIPLVEGMIEIINGPRDRPRNVVDNV